MTEVWDAFLGALPTHHKELVSDGEKEWTLHPLDRPEL